MRTEAVKKLLAYYRDVEFFNPFNFSKLVLDNPKSISIFRHSLDSSLPWNNPTKFNLLPDYEYAFDFFVTPFSVELALKTVGTLIPGIDKILSELSHAEIPGLSCVARIDIRKDIGVNPDELSLSTFPWALGELAKGNRLSLNKFETFAGIWISEIFKIPVAKHDSIEELGAELNKLPGKYPTVNELTALALALVENYEYEVCPDGLIGAIICRRGGKLKPDEQEKESTPIKRIKRKIDILNSFYLRDLERVADGESSPPLAAFLSGKAPEIQIDFRTNAKELNQFNSEMQRYDKLARWPFPSGFCLSTEQDQAIKWFLNDLPQSSDFRTPIIAVNGPPGTGKSSLVKQILAELIVKRALVLSKLRQPRDAFVENRKKTVRVNNYDFTYRVLIPELGELGLLIASNNNGAVENLTKELPRRDLLPDITSDLSYLNSVTERYEALNNNELNWWGLPSVPLGKKSNRVLFKQCLEEFKSKDQEEEKKKLAGQSLLEFRKISPDLAKSFRALQKEFSEANKVSPTTNGEAAHAATFKTALELCEAWLREVPGLDAEIKSLAKLMLTPIAFSSEESKDLWNLLFMIVPAISTTLASVERMLPTLQHSSIPFLIIEEAGQASPQSVLGAVLRSKKVLFIGDQRQLEPISNIPDPLDRYLKKELTETPSSSAQSIADNLSSIGTLINENSANSVWVGLPLLEHRRCDEPMFTLSNSIAYDGMMKNLVSIRTAFPLSLNSSWIQVSGTCSDRHWVSEQGVILETLLSRIYTEILNPNLFIITPFRSVKNGVSRIVAKLDESIFAPETGRPSVGTVHTFQGKEADIVIFILGCDHSKLAAADWAGEKPNLLNVAITRAKRRLFVIGDKNVWHGRGYFSDLVKQFDSQVI